MSSLDNESPASDTESRNGVTNNRFRALVEARLGARSPAEEPKEHHAQAQQESGHPRPRVSETTPITPPSTRSDQTIKQLRQENARLRKENLQLRKTVGERDQDIKYMRWQIVFLSALLLVCSMVLSYKLGQLHAGAYCSGPTYCSAQTSWFLDTMDTISANLTNFLGGIWVFITGIIGSLWRDGADEVDSDIVTEAVHKINTVVGTAAITVPCPGSNDFGE